MSLSNLNHFSMLSTLTSDGFLEVLQFFLLTVNPITDQISLKIIIILAGYRLLVVNTDAKGDLNISHTNVDFFYIGILVHFLSLQWKTTNFLLKETVYNAWGQNPRVWNIRGVRYVETALSLLPGWPSLDSEGRVSLRIVLYSPGSARQREIQQ